MAVTSPPARIDTDVEAAALFFNVEGLIGAPTVDDAQAHVDHPSDRIFR